MKIKFFIIILLLIFEGITLNGQDIPILTQKFTDGFLQLPSQAGASGGSAFSSFRKSYYGSNMQQIMMVGTHTLIANNKLGVGSCIYNDRINVLNNLDINMVVAYHLKISSKSTFSFGMNTEIFRFSINSSDLTTAVDQSDLYLKNFQPATKIEFSPGISVNNKRFSAAISINRLISQFKNTNENLFFLNSFYTVYGTYRWWLGGTRHLIEPIVTLRFDQMTSRFLNDYQCYFTYDNALLFGAGIRNLGSANFSVGYYLKKRFVFGYSYQLPIKTVSTILNGTFHELTIRFNFNKNYYSHPAFLDEHKSLEKINLEKF